MKKNILYLILVFILSLLVSMLLRYGLDNAGDSTSSISPLPDFLTLSKNGQVKLLDLWSPVLGMSDNGELSESDITAKSAIIYDLDNDKAIFEKNSAQRLPMASLTKIMTAIIALENKRLDDEYKVTGRDLVGEDSMGLSAGEVLTFDELLHGLMLPSGNDAAEVLAGNYKFGRSGFITAMNKRAESLGLTNTRFDNPSGLQGDGVQYTTAYDLLILTKYALDNYPEFRKTVSTAEYIIPQTLKHKSFELYNETNLLTTYEGVRGVKTGYTPEAGFCLVTYIDYKGHKLIGVILNSENRRGEMKNLLDYSLKKLDLTPPVYKG